MILLLTKKPITPFMQTIFRGTSGSNPGSNQKEAERDISRLLVTPWKWWLWRSTRRMAGGINLDYVIDLSYHVVWNLLPLSFSKHVIDIMI
jgi:hypothetical protein